MENGLKIPYKISLDFYIRKIITVNAKQLDTNSRVINITCTENGKKFFVDSSTTSAFVRYRKSDGFAVLNQVVILSDGTVNLELSQQMLAVEGRQLVDIMLINGTKLSVETVENILSSEPTIGVSVLSTMSFYINTEGVSIEGGEIESSYEYNALIDGLGKMVAVDQHVTQLEETISTNETQRQANEQIRQKSETDRINADIQRENNTKQAIANCETATDNANEATKSADIATANAETATNNANNATSLANQATERANIAAEECEKVIDGSNIVFKTDKGIANGVVPLDENALIPNQYINTQFESQLRELINTGESFDLILGKIYAYMQTINSMSQQRSDSNQDIPILLASSPSPTDGDSYESYYSGVTINPSTRTINSNNGVFNENVEVGNNISSHSGSFSENLDVGDTINSNNGTFNKMVKIGNCVLEYENDIGNVMSFEQ